MAKFKVDFSGVEESRDSISVVPGDYVAQVVETEVGEGKNYPYIQWKLKLLTGKSKGLHVYHYTSLDPSALFNLRNTLIAMGLKVPKAAVNVDPDKLIGKQLGINVYLDTYNGKEYPKVKSTFDPSKLTEEDTPDAPWEEVDDDLDDVMVME